VLEFLVLFSLAAAGSLVCVWANLVLKIVARKSRSETVATDPARGASAASAPQGDPVLAFGFTLACYGAISLVLVSALPGALALERTCLTFAVLCVGGLLSEISSTTTTKPPTVDGDEDAPPAQREPLSPRLSLTLALMLNLAFAVVSSSQGLIQIVPPAKAVAVSRTQEMEPIIVIARRTDDSADHDPGAL
jgi:hypothetical protein